MAPDTESQPQPQPQPQAPRSVTELFLTFAWIALRSFGGALAFIERSLVHDKRWLSLQEFVDLYAISQVLPGPSGLSLCVLFGDRHFGWRGATAALAGFVLVPCVGVLGLAALFQHFAHVPAVQGALNGMGLASAGLVLFSAARMARTLSGRRVGMAVAAGTFLAVVVGHWPVGAVVLTLGAASVAWSWWRPSA